MPIWEEERKKKGNFTKTKHMIKNVGRLDRVIRLSIAALILLVYANGHLTGVPAIILLAIAALMALTSLVRFCPAYLPFNLRTNAGEQDAPKSGTE